MIRNLSFDVALLPSYREHAASGLGRVRINGGDMYLAKYGTAESVAMYHLGCVLRVIMSEWPSKATIVSELELMIERHEPKSRSLHRVTNMLLLVIVFGLGAMSAMLYRELAETRQQISDLEQRQFQHIDALQKSLSPVITATRIETDIAGHPKRLNNQERADQTRARLDLHKRMRKARKSGTMVPERADPERKQGNEERIE